MNRKTFLVIMLTTGIIAGAYGQNSPGGHGSVVVQVGAFRNPINAQVFLAHLNSMGFAPVLYAHGDLHRVVVPVDTINEVPSVIQRLGNAGIRDIWVRQGATVTHFSVPTTPPQRVWPPQIAQPTPTQPAWPAQPAPTQPAWPAQPAQPAPTQPAWPAQPAPTQPAWPAQPAQPAPTQPVWSAQPAQPAPTQPAWSAQPAQPAPTQPAWPAQPDQLAPTQPVWSAQPDQPPPTQPAWPAQPAQPAPTQPAWPAQPDQPAPTQPVWSAQLDQPAQAQTALARGIAAQQRGQEIEAIFHFIQANVQDPELEEAANRLYTVTASLARGTGGTSAQYDIAWRRQWMDRLEEAENFFIAHTNRQSYFLIYEPNIREGTINHQDETVELRLWMSLVPDPVWADTINQLITHMASGVRATGRAEAWGIDWPNNHVSFSMPFNNMTNDLTVLVEIVNAQGIGIGRQTVNIPAGFDIHSRVSRNVIPRRWEGDVVFPAVNIGTMTGRLGIRVVSIDGVPAATAARQNGISVMSNEEFFRVAGIRKVPVDTSQFTVQADGTLTLWGGTGTEVDIPFMVNGVRVTAIGSGVFQGRGLTSVTIPDTVTSIGSNAFRGNRLIEVFIPESVTVIGASAFSGYVQRGISMRNEGQLRSVFIPDSVTSIGNEAFRSNQLVNVAIPDSVTVIGNNAFRNNRLASVTIGNGVTSIGTQAFYNNQLTSITIPSSIRDIHNATFRRNPQLTSISVGADVNIHGNAFFLAGWQSGENRDNLTSGFVEFYAQNGRRAGTYTRSGNTWVFTAR